MRFFGDAGGLNDRCEFDSGVDSQDKRRGKEGRVMRIRLIYGKKP